MATQDSKTARVVDTTKSEEIATRARRVFPGGVTTRNHIVQGFGAPIFMERGEGAYLYDVDGNRFTDYWMSHSALILGHNHPEVREAAERQLAHGTNFGVAAEIQVTHAERLVERYPSMDKVVIVDSNTRATTYALRLARAYTGRNLVAKMQGGYHGTVDSVFIGLQKPYHEPFGEKVLMPGVSPNAAADMVLMQWNDVATCEAVFREYAGQLAAVIVEPVLGDGIIPPSEGFLDFLRAQCDEAGALLVFDESMTCGMSWGGAQETYAVRPDLSVVGKSIGGGWPVAAFGGAEDVMMMTDAHAGMPAVPIGLTFPAHPVACAAGVAQLDNLPPEKYDYMASLAEQVARGVDEIRENLGQPISVTYARHLFGLHWNTSDITDWRSHLGGNEKAIGFLIKHLQRNGIYVGAQGRGCVSAAHTVADVEELVACIRDGVERLAEDGVA